MTVDLFSVPVFFVVFREALETIIIVSVLLVFLKQMLDGPHHDAKVYKRLVRQVWLGTAIGLLLCLIIGAGLVIAFYKLGNSNWEKYENIYEGSFAIFASIVISILGAALLRISKMQKKWRIKLAKRLGESPLDVKSKRSIFKRWCEKYVMFIMPFITIMREGLEAIIFVAGVSFSAPASAVPIPVVVGLMAGGLVGWFIYKCGKSFKIQFILIISTAILYIVAAGLFSRAIWFFEQQKWNNAVGGDAAEVGNGPGSYDIDQSVWHVNFGNPYLNGGGGWGVFNTLVGWQNSATYGSVISYNCYWVTVIIGFLIMRYKEFHGYYPFRKPKTVDQTLNETDSYDLNGLKNPTLNITHSMKINKDG